MNPLERNSQGAGLCLLEHKMNVSLSARLQGAE